MGLDMFAFTLPASELADAAEVDIPLSNTAKELQYWRKHHDLHGWMERLYRRKGGTDQQFNCATVRLTLADLEELEKAVREEGAVLPVTTGFFFGDNPPNAETREEDLLFITMARQAIAAGNAVIYSSWW